MQTFATPVLAKHGARRGDGVTLITVPEAAQLLRLSRASVYRAIARGDLPATRLGRHGHLRIPLSQLVARLAGGRHYV